MFKYYIKILLIIYLIFINYYLPNNIELFKKVFNNFLLRLLVLLYIIYNDDIQLSILLMLTFLYTIILINKYDILIRLKN